ncbi:MAG: glycosyltransferase family 2 protein [Xanthomonadaceae bacterium]|nr:glycosyltransferase family 2 protein [Xanthomonadaceae bacterium]
MQPPLPLSGIVITKNEGDRIARCLGSLRSICREIVVLDSGSTDSTVALARANGARVEHQQWLGFAAQKNAAIALATQPWVILLDADEWLLPEAQMCVQALFASGKAETADVWQLQRRTHFLGHAMAHGSFAREPVERLFRQHLRHALQPVHEYLETHGQRVARSGIRLEHDTARSADEYWRKLQGYARLSSEANLARGRTAWPGRGSLAALAYLLKNLLLRGGLLDGPRAWQFHWLHARYAALKYRLLRSARRQAD